MLQASLAPLAAKVEQTAAMAETAAGTSIYSPCLSKVVYLGDSFQMGAVSGSIALKQKMK